MSRSAPKFCGQCGATLPAGSRFCDQCGQPVAMTENFPSPQTAPSQHTATPATGAGAERITGIVPFLEQGIISVNHFTLVITGRRLLFVPWNPDSDEEMNDADDAAMAESSEFPDPETVREHFSAKDWDAGPWMRYLELSPDAIVSGTPGTIQVPLSSITEAWIINEGKNNLLDALGVATQEKKHEFDLIYGQGPYLNRILSPVLRDRLEYFER